MPLNDYCFKNFSYLQLLEIAALARSMESPSNEDKFATSYGPLSSFTEVAALEKMRFFPRVQSTSNCKFMKSKLIVLICISIHILLQKNYSLDIIITFRFRSRSLKCNLQAFSLMKLQRINIIDFQNIDVRILKLLIDLMEFKSLSIYNI